MICVVNALDWFRFAHDNNCCRCDDVTDFCDAVVKRIICSEEIKISGREYQQPELLRFDGYSPCIPRPTKLNYQEDDCNLVTNVSSETIYVHRHDLIRLVVAICAVAVVSTMYVCLKM